LGRVFMGVALVATERSKDPSTQVTEKY
jgi:deoxycytidylate deaminase